MKKFYALFLCVVIFLSGCALFSPNTKQNTKNQDKLDKVVQKSETTKTDIAKSEQDKLNQAATFSYGINYSLNQVTNVTQPVATALLLNCRFVK